LLYAIAYSDLLSVIPTAAEEFAKATGINAHVEPVFPFEARTFAFQ
jgi:hypothetical protein